jgi:hypothetical protein
VEARNAQLGAGSEVAAARFDWIWRYDVERANDGEMGDGADRGEVTGMNPERS